MWNKNYILLLQGGAVSYMGDVLYTAAIGYWVLQQTGSTAIMGLVSSVSMFMVLFLMPFSGSIADNSDRKRVIVLMDAVRGLLMLFMAVQIFTNRFSIVTILVFTATSAICSVFFSPAVTTVLMDVIPPHQFVRGQSLKSSLNSLLGMVGKAGSGFAVNMLGVPFIIAVNGLSYLFSALSEAFITLPETTCKTEKFDVVQSLKNGIETVLMTPALKVIVLSVVAVNICSSGSGGLFMAFCLQSGLDISRYGIITAVSSVASLAASVLLSAKDYSPKRRYVMMCTGFIIAVLSASFMCMVKGFYPITLMYSGWIFANSIGNAILTATLMQAMPQGSRGTLLGFVQSASTGAQAVSTLLYGFAGEILPLKLIYIVGNCRALIPLVLVCRDKSVKNLFS